MENFSHLTNGYKKNTNIRRKIAILGAPGSGKSTLSAGLLYFAKLFFFKSDSVPEVAKWDIYKKVDFTKKGYEEEKYNRQKSLEDIYPDNLDILICEAPLIMSVIYTSYYRGFDDPLSKKMISRIKKDNDRYTHYILSRKLVAFESFGRNETEEQAEEIHHHTIKILELLGINYTVINRYDDHIPLQVLNLIGAIRKK